MPWFELLTDPAARRALRAPLIVFTAGLLLAGAAFATRLHAVAAADRAAAQQRTAAAALAEARERAADAERYDARWRALLESPTARPFALAAALDAVDTALRTAQREASAPAYERLSPPPLPPPFAAAAHRLRVQWKAAHEGHFLTHWRALAALPDAPSIERCELALVAGTDGQRASPLLQADCDLVWWRLQRAEALPKDQP